MSAAEATAGGPRRVFSPLAPGNAGAARKPSPHPRTAEAPPQLRVVPPVTEPTPAAETPAAEPKVRRIDWAAAARSTASRGQVLYRDLVGAWVWRDVPPALRDIWAKAGQPPVQHPLLAAGWRAWMYAVALPWTAIGYTAVWLHQHPARGIPTDLAAGAAVVITVWG